MKSAKHKNATRCPGSVTEKNSMATDIAQENQAIKREKLDGGKSSHRVRAVRIKSSAELEEEMLAKIPKFKARPVNKKILEAPTLAALPRSAPQPPEFQEFHLKTMERANQHTETSSIVSSKVDTSSQRSLHSDSSYRDQQVPRITIPNPFHLHTEKRGLEKEKQFTLHVLQKQLEEKRARIPKANLYPYTTDYPVMPPKPEPKQCTKPETFQLESLVKHEEEMHRKFEVKEMMKKEVAQRRLFRAQPVLKEDPFPLLEKAKKLLTDVQEFVLHTDQRAVQRSEFNKKIKEKEMIYKKLREDWEITKQIEEEKVKKQMRRTMVHHARPLPKFHNPFQPQK